MYKIYWHILRVLKIFVLTFVYSIWTDVLEDRACTKSFQTRKQLDRYFAEVNGDYLECNLCKITSPGTKEYFIVCQLTNKHPEKHIMYSVKLREVFPNGVSASSRYEPRPFHRYQWRRFSPPPEDRIPEDHLELCQTLWHLRRKYPENFSATSIFLQLSVYNKTAGFARFSLTLFMPLTFHKPATITSDRTRYFSNRYCMI